MDLKAIILEQLSTNQFFSGTVIGGTILGAIALLRSLPGRIWNFLVLRFTVKVTINSFDPAFPLFHKWVNSLNFHQYSKWFYIATYDQSRFTNPSDDQPVLVGACGKSQESDAPEVLLVPGNGSYLVRTDGRWLLLTCNKNEPTFDKGMRLSVFETITLQYLGRSTRFVDTLVAQLRKELSPKDKKVMDVCTPHYGGWQYNNSIPRRSLDSMVLQAGLADQIVQDLENFYASESWYLQMGIPYHRGYLLAGPPGTGKSSLVHALASNFNKRIYLLSLASVESDESLTALFHTVYAGSILVLEDIDCMVSNRTIGKDQKVSFSTLLNLLDGVATTHGLVVFLTTNYPETLDQALVRKGRVDLRLDLELCSRDQVCRLHERFYGDPAKAEKFAKLVPEHFLSPAELQGHFLQHRDKPDEALTGVGTLLKTQCIKAVA